MTHELKIALAQLNPTVGDVAGNLAMLRKARATAANKGADLMFCAETVMSGYHILAWAGMFGPAGMPADAVKKVADAVHKALENPEVKQRFANSGTDVYWSNTEDFAAFVKSELVSWTAMIKEADIEPQ